MSRLQRIATGWRLPVSKDRLIARPATIQSPSLMSMSRLPRSLAAVCTVAVLGACARATAPAASPAAAPPASSPASVAAAPGAHDMAVHAGHAAHQTGGATAGAGAAATATHDHGAGLPPVSLPTGSLITEADVRFMQGMIAHHAQAVAMTRLAAGAGANPRVLKLAQKIDLSQAGEIVLMQEWLRAYDQFVPDTSSWRTMTMHGMLTAEEMAQLAAARGEAYDRLFLTYMIRHHEGALVMVKDLFATPRAGQEVDISVFANDVESTQSAEIALMRRMLLDL